MPKIQGKQIAESTITQQLLNLTTPTDSDTLSGATVEYVNQRITSATSGVSYIGDAEDGTYTDGIFTDFTSTTPIGTAIDRFNEMMLLLAPTPPSNDWSGVFSNLRVSSTNYDNMRIAGSGTVANNITTDTTPDYTLDVSIPSQGMNGDTGTFTISNDTAGTLDTVTLTTGDDSRVNEISLTEGDPYDGQSGKAGFWSGITSMNVTGSMPTITASATQHTLTFDYPDSGQLTSNFYVDSVSTPSLSSGSATFPTMTRYISGVPSLTSGSNITGIGFTVDNAVGYFYNPGFWRITGSQVNDTSYTTPSSTPTDNSSVVESGHSVSISSGYAETMTIQAQARNIAGTVGSLNISSNNYRIDTVSNESSRLVSSSGTYPSTGWGGTYDSEQVLTSGSGLDELQLLNGTYRYPTGNYTNYTDATNGAGPDYSSVTGIRWATFNIGSFNNNSAFDLTINGASGIGASYDVANFYLEVQISGQTSWVNADASYSGTGSPGSGADGVGAVVVGDSTNTVRRITFGSITYTGDIIVRIGLASGSGITFTGLSSSDIV